MSPQERDNTPQPPVFKQHRGPSAVWLLPVLAAIIAGWLVVKSYQERGIMIEVQFDSAEGLEADVTKVMYRGLPTGMIKSLRLNDDLKSVTAVIEMESETEDVLVEDTRFWLVKPQISLSGVKGLETLLSGYYLEFQRGSGVATRQFIADNEPPPPLKNKDGLYISLVADSAQSVYRGAKVSYRQIEVGEVIDFRLSPDADKIHIDLYIDATYTHLINNQTRFWNASGISLKADLPRIDIRFNSLASIIAGGISFYSPADDQPLDATKKFPLYSDFEAAEDGVNVSVEFPARTPLNAGDRVVSQGIRIGRVQQIEFNSDLTSQTAHLLIDPRAKPLLRAGSQFWLPEPELSLAQLRKVGELLKGTAIEMQPGPGIPQFSFVALNTPPSKRPGIPGLDIRIVSDQLGSLEYGSPILYRQIPVGEIRGYELIDEGRKVLIHATVKQEYASLVKANSRFWQSSGIKLNASIKGVQLETGSLASVINGGISFFTPDTRDQKPATMDQRYTLYQNFDAASNQGRLLYRENAGKLPLRLRAHALGSINTGSPVLFKQLPVGEVSHYALAEDSDAVIVHILIDRKFKHLVTGRSRFWNASGIHAKLGLSGVDIQTESVESLFSGAIAFANLAEKHNDKKAVKPRQQFILHANADEGLRDGPTISIRFPAGLDLTPGAAIRYKGLEMGIVDSVTLLDTQGSIDVKASLNTQGRLLAAEGSQFWIAGAVISLSGIDNPEALLRGNHIAAVPGQGAAKRQFIGLAEAPARVKPVGLNIILEAANLGSLERGSPVYYRGLPVGSVTGFELAKNQQSVEVYANIKPRYRELVKRQSRFWNISGFNADFGLFRGLEVETTTLDSFMSGGIAFSTPDIDAATAKENSRFKLIDESPD
ncbi:MAG: MlaD family protein [Amphritea sp.]